MWNDAEGEVEANHLYISNHTTSWLIIMMHIPLQPYSLFSAKMSEHIGDTVIREVIIQYESDCMFLWV